jgi:Protein of unknown function (DUF4085)
MRYFTRERLRRAQDDIGVQEGKEERDARLEAASQEWKHANQLYNDYLARVWGDLPGPIRELVETCLHDAMIEAVDERGSSVEIVFNTEHAPFVPRTTPVRLRFRGASYRAGVGSAIGQALLYDEVFVGCGCYEYNALLRDGECVVHFQELEIGTGDGPS